MRLAFLLESLRSANISALLLVSSGKDPSFSVVVWVCRPLARVGNTGKAVDVGAAREPSILRQRVSSEKVCPDWRRGMTLTAYLFPLVSISHTSHHTSDEFRMYGDKLCMSIVLVPRRWLSVMVARIVASFHHMTIADLGICRVA
jgi:hypothetical protein